MRNKILLLGAGELGKEFVIACQRYGQYVVAVDSYPGAPAMQVIGLSPEVTGVVQGFIVLFIAAPPLVRAIFRLPPPQKSTVVADWWAGLRKKGVTK